MVRSDRRGENRTTARKMRAKGEATSHKPSQGTGDGVKETASKARSRTLPSAGRISADFERYLVDSIPGQSPAICEYRQNLLRVLPSKSTLLVTGETGSGKSHLIEHILKSVFPLAPFVVIDLAVLPDSLIESELFGCEKGAFSGATTTRPSPLESADGGIVLLDEIGELSLDAQRKLLRLLENGSFQRVGGSRWYQMHGRIVALTNRNLAEMVTRDEFRKDLFFRLNSLVLHLPPLREIGEDILLYAFRFLAQCCSMHGKSKRELTAEAKCSLLKHSWPGNIRELQHVIEQAVLFCDSDLLDAHNIENAITSIPTERTAVSDEGSVAANADSEHADELASAQKSFVLHLGHEIRRLLMKGTNDKSSGRVPIQVVLLAAVLAARVTLGCQATQKQIGQFLGMSQPTVSRMLAEIGSAVLLGDDSFLRLNHSRTRTHRRG